MRHFTDYSAVADIFDAMTKEDINGQTPAQFAGSTYAWPIAIHFAELLIEHANLKSNSAVLDIGCGCGRIAAALTQHLSTAGVFYGVDIVAALTDFANQWVGQRYPNFSFMVHEQENLSYNKYKTEGHSQRIPSIIEHFSPCSIDVVLSTSLFTHLYTAGADDILKAISHVLKPSGCALVTAFLIDASTQHLITRGPAAFSFKYKLEDGVFAETMDEPLGAVAFQTQHFIDLLLKSGLYIERVLYGKWSGRSEAISGQDIIILRKF